MQTDSISFVFKRRRWDSQLKCHLLTVDMLTDLKNSLQSLERKTLSKHRTYLFAPSLCCICRVGTPPLQLDFAKLFWKCFWRGRPNKSLPNVLYLYEPICFQKSWFLWRMIIYAHSIYSSVILNNFDYQNEGKTALLSDLQTWFISFYKLRLTNIQVMSQIKKKY